MSLGLALKTTSNKSNSILFSEFIKTNALLIKIVIMVFDFTQPIIRHPRLGVNEPWSGLEGHLELVPEAKPGPQRPLWPSSQNV